MGSSAGFVKGEALQISHEGAFVVLMPVKPRQSSVR